MPIMTYGLKNITITYTAQIYYLRYIDMRAAA